MLTRTGAGAGQRWWSVMSWIEFEYKVSSQGEVSGRGTEFDSMFQMLRARATTRGGSDGDGGNSRQYYLLEQWQ